MDRRGHKSRRGRYHHSNQEEDLADNKYQQFNSLRIVKEKHVANREKHPPHLKGREIGMFYRNKQKNGVKQDKIVPVVQLAESSVCEISDMMKDLKRPVFSVNQSPGIGWRNKYESMNESGFKEKFFETLDGNDVSHFAKPGASSAVMKDSLSRDSRLDLEYYEELSSKEASPSYQSMLKVRKTLPAYSMCDEILKAVEENQIIVISGETGCGKTTQVAQFLLDNAIRLQRGSTFHAICTQPRRIAAISVAQRVAEERCEPVGDCSSSVGYQIRLERRLPRRRGSILYCTTGILIQLLQSDSFLVEVSHLIIDEVHERDVLSDFILTVIRDLLPKRPQLRVILMSATINAQMFSKYFNDCPTLHIPGRTFPVEDCYLEEILKETGYRIQAIPKRLRAKEGSQSYTEDIEYTQFMIPYIETLERSKSCPCHVVKSLRMRESEESPFDLIVELLRYICTEKGAGAILVFLTGWQAITSLHTILTEDRFFASSSKYLILPLHSMLPTVNQREVFDAPPKGVRKIILSTNISETSLTIEDVVYVVDTGKIKQSDYDAKLNVSTLQSQWISRANGSQRKGRAGRTKPGICYRLYTRFRESSLLAHPVPEMKRVRLEEVILRIKILKLGRVGQFLKQVPEPPDEKTVDNSLKLMHTIGALDQDECLTPLGFHLAQLPTDPVTGKLILMAAIFGCLEPVLYIAAALSFKDPFITPLNKEDLVRKVKHSLDAGSRSDHLLIATVMRQYKLARCRGWKEAKDYCYRNFLSSNTMSLLLDMAGQFARDLHERHFISSPRTDDHAANTNSNNNLLVLAVLCAGLFPNIAKIFPRRRVTTAEDGKVAIHPRSVNYEIDAVEFTSPWLVYHQKIKTTSIFIHDCSPVSAFGLMFFGSCFERREKVRSKHSRETVHVGQNITFSCNAKTADTMQMLKKHLDQLLAYRISHPVPTDWSSGSADSAILRAIVHLITAENDEQFSVGGRFQREDEPGYAGCSTGGLGQDWHSVKRDPQVKNRHYASYNPGNREGRLSGVNVHEADDPWGRDESSTDSDTPGPTHSWDSDQSEEDPHDVVDDPQMAYGIAKINSEGNP